MAVIFQGYGFSEFGQVTLKLLKGSCEKGLFIDSNIILHNSSINNSTLPSFPYKVTISCSWDAVFIHMTGSGYSCCYTSDKWHNLLSKIIQEKCTTLDDQMIFKVCELTDGNLYVQLTNGCCLITLQGHISDANTTSYYWKFTNNNSYCINSLGQLYSATDDDQLLLMKHIPLALKVTSVASGVDHVILLTENGTLYSYGLGTRGQLGTGDLSCHDSPCLIEPLAGLTIVQVAAGKWHSLALSESGDVYSWGWNQHCQLGHSQNQSIVSYPMLIEHVEPDVCIRSISCGARHSSCVSNGGVGYIWGWNGYKQIPNCVESIVKNCMVIKQVKDIYCYNWSTLVMTEN
jgi:hypothetical protein